MAEYGIVLVTVDTQETGTAIAEALVSDRLAACVNLFPVQSVYRWEGNIQQDSEWQLLIKTDLAQFTALEARLNAIHPYEVPEILALPIDQGAVPYLSWMAEQIR
ncbi:MAG: divalent-cation tolerance protein CutA [Leptolyngbya sp. SIO1D8]|nr:divalent-cation tolerance protein CutA [Leptolyngbya sp. SIO1D8]